MPSVPLPFVVALLLGIMLVRLLRRDLDPANRWLAAMIAAYALQAALLGLRWGYGIVLQPAQVVLAACLPPLSWLGFCALMEPTRQVGWHLLPPLVIAGCWRFAPMLLDPALMALFVGYGAALLRLARRGPDALARVTLGGAIPALRAMQVAGAMLIASAGVDLAVALVLASGHGASGHGERAGLISGLASLVFVAILGWAAVVAGESAPPATPAEPEPEPAPDPATSDRSESAAAVAAEDATIVARLDHLMRDRALHHDPTLNLDRLGRRLGLPARRLSAAINRVRGVNVSQYVNALRVEDARRLLADPATPVTRVLLEVGFQTKSNFNREFLRITGMSPTAWRRRTEAGVTAAADPPA